jgi:hypothetical protein
MNVDGPKGPGLGLTSKGFNGLSLLRQSVGVMEWWSNGVMRGLIQVEIGL